MISIVFPTYNEEENVGELHRRTKKVLEAMGEAYEIIAIENGSPDKTLEILKQLSPIKIIVFNRNFGQTLALDAGLKASRGEVIITMDADLQNDPADIPRLVVKLNEGYDVVAGWRRKRHDSLGRKIHSRLANWLTRKISGLNLHDHACAFKAYRREALRGVSLYGVQHVFLAAYLYLRGARVTEIEVQHHERKAGFSKHRLMAGLKAIADLVVVRFMSPDSRPMLFFSSTAVFSWLLAMAAFIWAVILKRSPIIFILFVILGFLLFMMGFLAEMLWRNYFDSRHDTPYRIHEIIERQ